MTIASTSNKTIYTGNNTASKFTFTFKVFASTDLVVTKYTIADGTEDVLTLTTEYTVSLTGGGVSGGEVTLVAGALSSAYKLIIERVMAVTQETDYVENDPFPADDHEDALDKLTMICQQLKEQIGRAVLQDSAATSSLTMPTPEAGKYLYALSSTVLDWVSLTDTSAYAGTISSGNDASKPTSPTVGDLYFALDTGKIYYCASAGTWSEFLTTVTDALTDDSAATLTAGMAVYISGASAVSLADATDTTKPCVGFCDSTNGTTAQVRNAGKIQSVPVVGSAVSAGDKLFLSETAGSLTKDAPTTSGAIQQIVGYALTNEAASVVDVLISINPNYVEV